MLQALYISFQMVVVNSGGDCDQGNLGLPGGWSFHQMISAIGWWKIHGEVFPATTFCSRGFVIHRHSSCSKLSVVSRAEPSFSSEEKDLTNGSGTLTGAVVALGKFDALHIGHRALVEQAARMGAPVLLSFTGMAQILGWEKRLPIVAPIDRARVMSLWSLQCGGLTPTECSVDFGSVRHLSPAEFVKKLAAELHVKGVVAGENYRFGYKAAGDATDLKRLCTDWGLQVFIVQSVMDEFEQAPPEAATADAKDRGQVSSTRVRKALARGNMKRVKELLGRNHRLLLPLGNATRGEDRGFFKVPISDSCNQHPAAGSYQCKVAFQHPSFNGNGALPALLSCEVDITEEDVVLRYLDDSLRDSQQQGYMIIEF